VNVTHVELIIIRVTDQDRTKAFHVDTLGFEVVIDQQAGPVRWLQVGPKGARTSFTLAGAAQGFTPGTAKRIMLESVDLDADRATSAEAGIEVDGPRELPWGREAAVVDPDGNRLVLAAPAPTGR
jgi:predicted enzyme related to lactoylglutathione lyase